MEAKSHTLVAALLGFAVVSAAQPSAHAQSSSAQAETLFRQGKELLAQGKVVEACAAFDASQKLGPTLATLLNQASCREKNGQLATAWGLFLDAERQSRAAIDEATRQLHQVATDHAAKLEHRLSTLTITVLPGSRIGGLEILRNDEPVDPGAWNQALPVDGGTYTIMARAPGNADWTSTITVGAERDAKTIEAPKHTAAALRPSAEGAEGATADRDPESAASPARRSKVAPLAVGGGALVLIGSAIGVELWASSAYDESRRASDPAAQTSLWHSANNRRYVAEGLAVGGLAAGGVAVWLYLRGGERDAAGAHQVTVAPLLGADRALAGVSGLVVSGRY